MSLYQGHMPNSGIQRHSAGDWFPFILVQKGLGHDAKHGILYGSKVQWFMFEDSRRCELNVLLSFKNKTDMIQSFINNPFTEDYK